jgi:hypothetical protein
MDRHSQWRRRCGEYGIVRVLECGRSRGSLRHFVLGANANMVSRQFCSLIFGALLCLSSAARAQQQPEQRSDQEIALVGSLLVSLQPELDGCCEPYLAGPLGGSKLGVGGSLTVAQPNGFVFAVELNTAMPMSGSQSGRIVPGPGAVVSTHGDTLISALPGVRQRLGTAAVDFLGGPTLVFGSSGQGGQSVDSAPGLAVTGGFDVIIIDRSASGGGTVVQVHVCLSQGRNFLARSWETHSPTWNRSSDPFGRPLMKCPH